MAVDFIKMMSIPSDLIKKWVWDSYVDELFKSNVSIKLSIVGPRLSGKTTMFDIIRDEDNVKEENGRGTSAAGHALKRKTVKIGEKDLVIKDTFDYDGELSSTKNYARLFRGADVILYLFDIEKFIDNRIGYNNIHYQEQVASMLRIFCIDGAKHIKKQRAYIIGTRKDKLKNFSLSPRKFKEEYFFPFLKKEDLEEVTYFPFEALNLKSVSATRSFLEKNIYRFAK